MDNLYSQNAQQEHFHTGHVTAVFVVAILLIGASWLKNPQLFNVLRKSPAVTVASVDVPKYYAYETPASDRVPLVAGATTQNTGPSIINEDGSITPALDAGEVLGASTSASNTPLSLDQIQVNRVPDSAEAGKKYFADSRKIESGYIDNVEFQTALTSGKQTEIDKEAVKINEIKINLLKLQVPVSLVRLQKLKIAQYQAAVGLLNNFTQADAKPELVGKYLNVFLQSQQQLENENIAIEKKYHIDLGYPIVDDTTTAATTSATALNNLQTSTSNPNSYVAQ